MKHGDEVREHSVRDFSSNLMFERLTLLARWRFSPLGLERGQPSAGEQKGSGLKIL